MSPGLLFTSAKIRSLSSEGSLPADGDTVTGILSVVVSVAIGHMWLIH